MNSAAPTLTKQPEPGVSSRYRRYHAAAEPLWIALLILLTLHFAALRINSRYLPHGDEGSWMSVAAELSKGNGFSTRWLEHPFLKPYTLPRPDDYRYPGLGVLLAAAFKLFGTGYSVALWMVTAIFIVFGLAFYTVARRTWGIRVACVTLPLVYFSLLQLMYATEVYSEGLFGIGLTLVVGVSARYKPDKPPWWILTGASIGLLYLIRPNAILFAFALTLYGAFMLFKHRVSWRPVAAGTFVMLLVMLPWLIRTGIEFGNPFHLAASADLLRAQPTDPATYSLSDFTRIYGVFYFVKTIFLSVPTFFRLLHEQEHGLELIPAVFVLIGVVRKGRFFNGMIVTGFTLTLIACFYTSSRGNWTGIRFFSSFLPFAYAYGINQLFGLWDLFASRMGASLKKYLLPAALPLVIGILIAPVYHPHRYYERFHAKTPQPSKDFSGYYSELGKRLANRPCYYAGSLAQINFPTGFNCIGMQFYFDEKEIRRAQKEFNPTLLALTPKEFEAPYFNRLMNALRQEGFTLSPEMMPDSFAVFVTIQR